MKRMVFAVVVVAVLMVGSEVSGAGNWGRWTQMDPSTHPLSRAWHAMAYDAESDRGILFGGISGATYFDETWAYDHNTDTWTEMGPANRPTKRYVTAMAYDGESDRVILFGGDLGGPRVDDTWAYDFNTDTWTEMNPADHPSARRLHAMAYDAESDRVMLFGGQSDSDYCYDDTWAYDFNTDTWTQMNPPSRPNNRRWHSMAYDAESDRVTLFGGEFYGSEWHMLDDTWAYNHNTDSWAEMTPPNRPCARSAQTMAYDAENDRVVLFTGWDTNHNKVDDIWVYDLNTDTWEQMNPASSPGGRIGHAMVYDAESDRAIVFSGGNGGLQDDTWAFDAGVFSGPDDWLWPVWNWISIPAVPDDPDPNQVLGFDCSGRIWYWDKYGKTAQVYQPPFVTFDMMVADSYLLLLDEVPDPVWYGGSFVRMPFEFKLGRMGWTWLGMPRLTELGTTDFMDNVCVQYPVGGPVRTAAEDYGSTPDNWLSWGWSFWDGQAQAPKTFTPYSPFGDNVCHPWVGYRVWINVGTATGESDPDQVTLIWPQG